MTTLVAWISYPRPGYSSAIYLASDSRITWGSQNNRWDAGRKLFTTTAKAHAFGYCGDVVFPSLVLAQVTSAIDHDLLFDNNIAASHKHAAVVSVIKTSFGRRHNTPDRSFDIVHAYRHGAGRECSFHLWRLQYDHSARIWSVDSLSVPVQTETITELGTGARATQRHHRRWGTSDVAGSSRAVFSAFGDALQSQEDPLSGGAPQLAALYRRGPAQSLGVGMKGGAICMGCLSRSMPSHQN
jgi:hypothetical protein